VTQQAASKAAADLERRGLLRREPAPGDARTTLPHLTEHARDAVDTTRLLRGELHEELVAEYGAGRVEDAREVLASIIGRYGGGDAVAAAGAAAAMVTRDVIDDRGGNADHEPHE
jgi:DNA-binding MarR family transcriptional regulator